MTSIALDHRAAANAYAAMGHHPDASDVRQSYAAFANMTMLQWNALRHRVDVEFFTGEPRYSCSADMLADLERGHLWTYLTDLDDANLPADHPMRQPLTLESWEAHGVRKVVINDIFRAVHDVNGHGTSRGSFGVTGEMNAWLAHRMFYGELAHAALWCETRGQAAWTNAYSNHATLALVDRPFALQKAGNPGREFI